MRLVFALSLLSAAVHSVLPYNYYEERPPTHVTAEVGGHVAFNCFVDFPQDIEIPYVVNWEKQRGGQGEVIFSSYDGVVTSANEYVGRIRLLKDDNSIATSKRFGDERAAFGRASINLTSIRESDAGWYQCRVVFPNRTPSSRPNGTWFELIVSAGNLLAVPPVNQTTLEGAEAHFSCLAKDPEYAVTWLKDGIRLREYQDLSSRAQVAADHTLVIRATDMGDYGEYACEVVSPAGEKQTARAFLNVQYKAKVVFSPAEIHLPFGQPAILDCHFRANPPLTNLRWEKDGFLFDPYNIQGVFYRRNGSLYFTKVDESHNGRYTCTPFNELGSQGPSPPIVVVVQKPPVFLVTPHNLYLRKLGETIEMPCDARDGDASHRPIIVWRRRDGAALPAGRHAVRGGNLTISDVRPEDRGLYQCAATNKAATITAEAELLVENVPSSAPHNLTAVASATSVYVTWRAGRQRPNTDHSVWYKPVGSSEWRTHPVMSSRLEATLTGLAPGVEYELMVLCKDDSGDGIFSKSVRIWTRDDAEQDIRTESGGGRGEVGGSDNRRGDNGRGVGGRRGDSGRDGGDRSDSSRDDSGRFRSQEPSLLPAIGFPRNLTLVQTKLGYLLTWLPPELASENVQYYIVRWFQGPDDYLFGSDETQETSYLLADLSEGNEFNIQVIAVSFNGQQAISEKLTVFIPGYKSIGAVSTGIISGLLFLIAILGVIYYSKRKFFHSYPQNLKN